MFYFDKHKYCALVLNFLWEIGVLGVELIGEVIGDGVHDLLVRWYPDDKYWTDALLWKFGDAGVELIGETDGVVNVEVLLW